MTEMTDEQIENWRKMLLGLLGPYALVMPREKVVAFRDKYQGDINKIEEMRPVNKTGPVSGEVIDIIRGKKVPKGHTNAEYAKTNKAFRKACANITIAPAVIVKGKIVQEKETLPPTSRQASKWRRGTGRAWNEGRIGR